ncbi:MAG: phage terminase small subunit P27 family, partial [Deltaproteobacteria bacterium]|nr:phage terminase small subunit P27 family [Deltaproteobacteria bacterium]
ARANFVSQRLPDREGLQMPKGGARNNKPTHLHILEGTARKDRHSKSEPKPKPVAGETPKSLDRYGKEAWKRLAPILERIGTLTEADSELFATFCDAYSQWRRATKTLRKLQPLDDDYRKVSITVENARKDMRLIGGEFGIGAASRGRITVKGETTKDDMDALLGG